MERPIVKFAMGGLLGGLASLSISFGPMALLASVALALFVAFLWRSYLVLSGVLCGFGLTWLVLIGSNYTHCVSMGPNCVGGESMVPFLVIAGLVLLTGMAVGLAGSVRDRRKTRGVSGSSP